MYKKIFSLFLVLTILGANKSEILLASNSNNNIVIEKEMGVGDHNEDTNGTTKDGGKGKEETELEIIKTNAAANTLFRELQNTGEVSDGFIRSEEEFDRQISQAVVDEISEVTLYLANDISITKSYRIGTKIRKVNIIADTSTNIVVESLNNKAIFCVNSNDYDVQLEPIEFNLDNIVIDGNGNDGRFLSANKVELTIDGNNTTEIKNFDVISGGGGGALQFTDGKAIVKNISLSYNTTPGNYNGGAINFTAYGTPEYTLTLDTVEFIGNRAPNGGGLSANATEYVTIKNCYFKDNEATKTGGGAGGAVYLYRGAEYSSVEIEDSKFINNKSYNTGGAISNVYMTDMTIDNCEFTGNESREEGSSPTSGGGAIYVIPLGLFSDKEISFDINGTTFNENKTVYDGGAILIGGDYRKPVNMTIGNNTIFTNNTAKYSGGALSAFTPVNLEIKGGINEFSGNIALEGNGGAINLDNNGVSLRVEDKSEFTNNEALEGYGGAIYLPGLTPLLASPLEYVGEDILFDGNKAKTSINIMSYDDYKKYKTIVMTNKFSLNDEE